MFYIDGPLARDLLTSAGSACDHKHSESGYQPSRRLQHLIESRSTTCSAPGCQHAASRCDLDHPIPHDQGSPTCECNLAPLCRHHHRCRQSSGWALSQPSPGVLRWTTRAAATTSPLPPLTPSSPPTPIPSPGARPRPVRFALISGTVATRANRTHLTGPATGRNDD